MALMIVVSRHAIENRFPALLPERAWIAHKTGNLPQVVHDAGIIYTASGPVFVVGMSKAMPDRTDGCIGERHTVQDRA